MIIHLCILENILVLYKFWEKPSFEKKTGKFMVYHSVLTEQMTF